MDARSGDNQFAVDAIREHQCTTHGPEARVTIEPPVEFASWTIPAIPGKPPRSTTAFPVLDHYLVTG
jgi:hypothetical protein